MMLTVMTNIRIMNKGNGCPARTSLLSSLDLNSSRRILSAASNLLSFCNLST